MQPQQRLRARADFERARKTGRSYFTPLLTLQAARTESDVSRCGFAISKRVGTAVVRNRIRRRLREIMRRRLQAVDPGWNLVLSARPRAAQLDSGELAREVDDLLKRARLVPR